jgi:1,2-diacylglycerol-3-alpha-glucose alpha-1,2-galactosyltransferase
MRINMLSESEFTVQGHGVHTAYEEMRDSLKNRDDIDIQTNTSRNAEIIHAQTIGSYVWRQILRQPRAKRVFSVHVVPASLVGSIKLAKIWLPAMKIYMKWFYNRADLLLACSGKVAETLKNDLKIKPRVEVLYNFVDMKKYHLKTNERKTARKNLKISRGEFVIIGNGQLQPRKRIDTFINVAKKLPDFQFIWIGGIPFKSLGAESGKMKKMVENAPKNVTFTGIIDHAKVREYLAAADVFFLPAEQENHPMCVLEAAGANLPIVLRDIVEYNDTFAGNALMGNDENFAKIIADLKDQKRYAAAICGTKNIAKKFDSSTGGKKLVEFYKSVL